MIIPKSRRRLPWQAASRLGFGTKRPAIWILRAPQSGMNRGESGAKPGYSGVE